SEIVAGISDLADITVHAALSHHSAQLAATYDLTDWQTDERAQLAVIGMGKLGGYELNVSSDIDLVFVYAEDGDANADHSWREFHTELGKRLIRSLDQADENGFVFRVDMRLRPFGASGPLASSLDALETYFRTQARPWERYAWLKARTLSGGSQTRSRLENIIIPFVYRRYHDYAAIDEMRELHSQIRREATQRNRLEDIKVGPGGIREIEFIAQLFQLVRGGRDHSLQTRSTREALQKLAEHNLLAPSRVDHLQTAYTYLRNLEHRLQYLDDQQTQALPRQDADRQRIAVAMGCPDWPVLEAQLQSHRQQVTTEFEALFATASENPSSIEKNPGNSLEAAIHAALRPIDQHQEACDAIRIRIHQWQQAQRTLSLPAKTRSRIEALLPVALAAALQHDHSPRTFFRLFDLLEAIDKRETYLALLAEYPPVLQRVAHIAARSAWAADFLRRHPILLDELIPRANNSGRIDWAAQRAHLQAECDRAEGDTERQYELLRHTKQIITLRLNIADLEGRLGVMALSDELSALADLLMDSALVLANRALGSNALPTADRWTPPAGFAIVGYGKLGSKELGYASDLDLVFLYDDQMGIAPERYARLAQRLNSWLNTQTVGGVLYETDLRLRPDGAAGLLVSSLSAYRDYQLHRAWTWEHQALTRARWCAGDKALAAPFEAIRREVLCRPRDREALCADIIQMRDKMRAEKKDRADRLDLKHTRGGMVDVEFIVQYLILAYSVEHPEFLGNLGNFALLARAGALGILDEDLAAGIAKAYLAYRERQHHARTNNETTTWINPDELIHERHAVTTAWASLLR
ncbi:MAG: bifunctional [glutamate--ammonia ligase]-adenylyl-L-tyrosine phosphorylase/[glutamate--ammonia-ligase] adenylyltransferase, partial [Betaproteobacteria bacterium]|nr:bifunctional [glutamate--ammonia ligase]-adenylyl-L-tyrosine phosphorylase/[glutamate--ammonia-ligase] adenylyltransferase [Betaproteobacteria bacterium]